MMMTDNRSAKDDRLSVAPPDPSDDPIGNDTANQSDAVTQKEGQAPVLSADAGTDESIQQRLERNPQSEQARIDRGSDESMDASDPISVVQPGRDEPAPSSGYDKKLEQKLAEGQGS